MGNESIPELTSEQAGELMRTALQYRVADALGFSFGSQYLEIRAYQPGTTAPIGTWSIEYRLSGNIILTVTLGGKQWKGDITKQMPAIWPAVIRGLHDWCKAVNHIELTALPEGSRPSRIIDNSTLNPNDYSPLGRK